MSVQIRRADLPLVAATGVTGIVVYNLCFLNGVRPAPSSDGAVIVPGLSPVVVAAMVAAWYGIRPPRWDWPGSGSRSPACSS